MIRAFNGWQRFRLPSRAAGAAPSALDGVSLCIPPKPDKEPMVDELTFNTQVGPLTLEVSETTFRPSTVTRMLADNMTVSPNDTVIDVGTGSGVLAILAAKLGSRRVYATDTAPDVVEIGSRNAARHGVADNIEFLQGDLFDPIPADVRADLIVGDVSGIPDALARESGWFPSGSGGGPSGIELPIRMLRGAIERLQTSGRLLLPAGSIQDESTLISAARALFGSMRRLAERVVPLPQALADSEVLAKLVRQGMVHVTQRGSRMLWSIGVWECTTA
jgi:release factor glutamine methyltransferase